MKKILILTAFGLLLTTNAGAVSGAQIPKENPIDPIARPVVSNITDTTAVVSAFDDQAIHPDISAMPVRPAEKYIYFVYGESRRICTMQYPPSPECSPKYTTKGQYSVTLTNLTPDTWYYVKYVKDSSIQCIKAPCPTNEFTSEQVEFKTLSTTIVGTTTPVMLQHNLWFRSYGKDVRKLQEMLMQRGFLSAQPSGYFGVATLKAVKDFQRIVMHIAPTGYVGLLTRIALSRI